jgi:hypothetical protein
MVIAVVSQANGLDELMKRHKIASIALVIEEDLRWLS